MLHDNLSKEPYGMARRSIAGLCLLAFWGQRGAAPRSGWSSCLAVRTGRLKRSPAVHARPIDLVVFQEPTHFCWKPHLGGGFALRCLQRLSCPDLATRRCRRAGQPAHQRSVLPNPLVLGETLLKFPTPTADRDRPVSRRSEPSSRTAFIGEQPNPWDLLQPQDAMSRHRGAKPPRR